MREGITVDDLFAEVILLGEVGKTIILVEGPDDVGALDAHISEDSALLVPGFGKPAVEQVVALADDVGLNYVLAILDRDWVGILDEPSASPNIIYTDMYDIDATIVAAGDICKRVVTSFCDIGQVRRHLARTSVPTVLGFAIGPSLAVGVLRAIAHEAAIPLSVREFPVSAIMDLDGGPPDIDKMIVIAIAKSRDCGAVDRNGLAEDIRNRMASVDEPIRYCSGHELVTALSNVMRKRWGSNVKAEVVAKAIRAALGCVELMSTTLYRDVERWCSGRHVTVWTCATT